jgi:hypothetical protein
MAKLDGSCLCGKVTYSCAAEPAVTAVCHCTDCQKQTGTTFSIIVGVPTDALEVEGELSTYTTIGTDTEQPVARKFCANCGSPVMSAAEAFPQLVFIKAGTLNDTSWLEPQMHVWTDSAQDWFPLEAHAGAKAPRGPSG